LYYTDTTPATHAITRTNEVTAEGEEEEEEEASGVVGSEGASSEKRAQLQLTLHREEEEEEDEDEDEDEDVGGDAGLHNRSSARPGTASPLMQPCPHARDTSSEASLVSRHGVDAEGRNACQMLPLPLSRPELGSSNTMDIDQANCNPSDTPTDSIGGTEVVVAAGNRDSFEDATSDATSHRTDDRGGNPGAMLAPQTSSERQSNILAHPDSESSMDVDMASIGESQAEGSGKAHAGQDAMDVDGAHDVEPREPAQLSDTGDPALRRSSRDQNPPPGNKKSIPAPTNSRKRSKKRSTNHNPLKPKPLVTVMEETDSSFCEAILVDLTIDELEADMVSTLNPRTHSGGGYSSDRWRPRETIWGKHLWNT
jgi:hypothetical protein